MGRFRFRLDKVLAHRRRVVDLQSREVAAVQVRIAAVVRQIAACHEEQRICRAGDLPLRADALAGRAAWLARLDRIISGLESELARENDALATARSRLQEVWREREVLEQLRRRREQEWRLEETRRERIELDEIGQQRSVTGAVTRVAG